MPSKEEKAPLCRGLLLPRSLAEKPQKCTKSAENCAHSYTVFEPKTCQEWLFGCVSRGGCRHRIAEHYVEA